jgi:hypothetical protein
LSLTALNTLVDVASFHRPWSMNPILDPRCGRDLAAALAQLAASTPRCADKTLLSEATIHGCPFLLECHSNEYRETENAALPYGQAGGFHRGDA